LALELCKPQQEYDALAALLSAIWENLERVHAELAELIRKNDDRFREEEFGPEGDSCLPVDFISKIGII
jgi:hypothetical protein